MKFSHKLSSGILITGLFVLIVLSVTNYQLRYSSTLNSQLDYTQSLSEEVAEDINILLFEKVKIARTLASSPIIIEALEESIAISLKLSPEKRNNSLELKNKKWKSIKNPDHSFIKKITDNRVSLFLKKQQRILTGEYGEIFLTNSFGALVASTSKLSTFAHGHKYWWLGAYNNGDPVVFFDDRGYDDSVDGYVLGLVVPVVKEKKIIGILKCDLNILGSISSLLTGAENHLIGEFKLARSGGMIIFEKGREPLSTLVQDSIRKGIEQKQIEPLLLNDSGLEYLVGFSEIELTRERKNGFGFGGTFESIDHKKGNKGESWYLLCYREMSIINDSNRELFKSIILSGLIVVFILFIVSWIFGNKIAKPLAMLVSATNKIGKGELGYRIDHIQGDEFGHLATSFNSMVDNIELRKKKLREKTEELKEKNLILGNQRKKLEQVNRLKTEFLANMSHELRTPLNSIMTLSHVLKTDTGKKLDEEEKDYLNIINRNGKKLLLLINDILELSKIESSQIEINSSVFSLKNMIEDIMDSLEILAKEKGLHLISKITDDLQIETDESGVYHILQNLIGNAIKFTEQGGVNIISRRDGNNIRVEIIDTGIGIPDNEIQNIFDEFRQIDGSSTRKFEGTGLGLAIACKYAKLLNGDLVVKSIPGKGSTFTLILPEVLNIEKTLSNSTGDKEVG
jgi:signal transduction histidine kinase